MINPKAMMQVILPPGVVLVAWERGVKDFNPLVDVQTVTTCKFEL